MQMIPPALGTLARPAPIDETPGPAFEQLQRKHKLTTAEYARVKSILGRVPTLAELGVFSAMWSEHCSYKSSRVHLKRLPTEGPDVVVGPGENAGVVRLSGKLCLAFKMESHNHPSYIEPYQGAATGVGGILRDVFCMGARPIANLNALRFGLRSHERTPFLLENAVKGIGDYGNCIGVPTVGGNVSFDQSYNGNCLVNAMTVGVIHEDHIFKGYATGQGNIVVYLGSATGRDGIHGASMASGSFASQDANSRSTVQVGDPFTEKLLLEATLDVLDKGLVIGLQDMGAAGLTSSAFEMAGRAGNGLYLDLDQVPVRTTAMSAYELLLSESQERMLMVVEPGKWSELQSVLAKWQLACTVIGVVTDTGRVQIQHQGRLEVDVPVDPMTELAPKYNRPMQPRSAPELSGPALNQAATAAIAAKGGASLLLDLLHDTGDKLPLYRQYDRHIGRKTVHASESQGGAVLWLRSEWADPSEPYLGVVMTASCNERYNRLDATLGAAHAVLKSARMIAACGGVPIAATDCLNYGNPEDPEVMDDFSRGIDGIGLACRELNVPIVSGNVSLYNETDGQSIAPTPMIGMVGKLNDVRLCPLAAPTGPVALFLLHGNHVTGEFGGSLAAKALGLPLRAGRAPEIDWAQEREAMDFLRALNSAGQLAVARDVGDGGILTTAAKMALLTGQGLTLSLAAVAGAGDLSSYFAEVSGCYLIALHEAGAVAGLRAARDLHHCSLTPIGTIKSGADIRWGEWSVGVDAAHRAFCSSLILS